MNTQISVPRCQLRLMADYRVMALHRDQSLSLVTLAENLRQATNRARAFCKEMAASSNGFASVRVEEWVGTLTEGEWKPVSLGRGGFSHWFASHLSKLNGSNGYDRSPSLPKAGDEVQCALLAEKTRKGGWKAKSLQRGIEGPITNTEDVPKSAEPGQRVTLCVGSISNDGKRIQFHWNQSDNPERR